MRPRIQIGQVLIIVAHQLLHELCPRRPRIQLSQVLIEVAHQLHAAS